ncbi:hypothetical protein BGX29_006356 [Mortierella sp. GBA35]|nr:hypothetical protein BGX29_006356 [Mortierella sp. GBA35]
MTFRSDFGKPAKYRKILVVSLVLAVATLVLSLALILGLRTRDSTLFSQHPYDTTNTESPWNDPSEFLLRKNFSITRIPTTRYYEWTISQHVIAPDGYERPMLLVNGMFPGPLVEANTGDRIVVKVTNNMANGTAIHWHGMFQNGKYLYEQD